MAYKPHGSFNAKALFVKEQQWYYLNYSLGDKGVHDFPINIRPKVNVIALLEFELAYFKAAVQQF